MLNILDTLDTQYRPFRFIEFYGTKDQTMYRWNKYDRLEFNYDGFWEEAEFVFGKEHLKSAIEWCDVEDSPLAVELKEEILELKRKIRTKEERLDSIMVSGEVRRKLED